MPRPFPRRPLRLLAWALLTAGASGCSVEAPEERATPPEGLTAPQNDLAESAPTPGCELITAAEIEAAMGQAPARSEWDDSTLRGCSWYRADGRPLLGLVIGAAPATYEEYLDNVRQQTEETGSGLAGVETSRVDGIGDYAVWHEQEGSSYLNAARNGELFNLMIFGEPVSGKTSRDAVVELARIGVPRM
jgi:hypothetical protein